MRLPAFGTMSNIMTQREPSIVAGPIVVGENNLMVPGHAAGRDEGAAIARSHQVRNSRPVLLAVSARVRSSQGAP